MSSAENAADQNAMVRPPRWWRSHGGRAIIPPALGGGTVVYDAFISYSHSADGRLAPAVQAGLQRLARPWYRIRALRVFRDESGVSVNPPLWTSVGAALGAPP